jgi:hypothetical protein
MASKLNAFARQPYKLAEQTRKQERDQTMSSKFEAIPRVPFKFLEQFLEKLDNRSPSLPIT